MIPTLLLLMEDITIGESNQTMVDTPIRRSMMLHISSLLVI